VSVLTARCPAKINLALHVAGRRPDGFHEIVTLFQTIDLADDLHVEAAPTLTLSTDAPSVPVDGTNLVLRAAALLAKRVPSAGGRGARFRLHKEIPAAAGLGGGSSDAAGALVLLNRLWGLDLGATQLASLGAELGSDVPFFLIGGTALGTGRGERIEPLPPIAGRAVLLGTPREGLATAAVYAALGAPLTVPGSDVTVPGLFVNLAERNDFALATNDLEGAVVEMRPELSAFRRAVSQAGAELARVSGSGSTVFGLFPEGTDLNAIADGLRGRFPDWTLRATRTVAARVRIVPAVG